MKSIFKSLFGLSAVTLLSLSASAQDQIYLIGDQQGSWNPESSEFVLEKTSDGVYEATFDFPKCEKSQWFRFYSQLGPWSDELTQYSIGPTSNDLLITFDNGEFQGELATEASENTWILANWPGGDLTMKVDINNHTFDFTTKVEIPDCIYLYGNMTGWNPNMANYPLFKTENGTYEGTFFIDGSEDTIWFRMIKNLGDGTNDQIGPEYNGVNVEFVNGQFTSSCFVSSDENNWTLTDWEGGEVKIIVDLDDNKVTFQEVLPEFLYLIGDMQSNAWTPTNGEFTIPSKSYGVYEAQFEFPAKLGKQYFRFYSRLGEWSDEFKNYSIGASENDLNVEFTDGIMEGTILMANENCWVLNNWAGGELSFTIDIINNTITFATAEDYEPLPLPEPDGEHIYLMGDMNGWNYQNGDFALTKTSDGLYSGEFDLDLSYDAIYFRFYEALIDYDPYSIGAVGEGNVDITLEDGVYKGESGNTTNCWVLPYWPGGKITMEVNVDSNEVTFTTDVEFVEPGPAELGNEVYLIGDPVDWNIDSKDMPLVKSEEGVYTATFTIPALLDEDNNYKSQWFRFYTVTGSWASINSIGASVDNLNVEFSEDVKVFEDDFLKESENCWILPNWEGGEIYFVLDFNDGTLTMELVEDTDGINTIGGTEDIETIYNLQGVKVSRNNMNPGIYVVNGKKVYVK